MPHYNIWIREEDNDKWLSITNRSEWLHAKLDGQAPAQTAKANNLDELRQKIKQIESKPKSGYYQPPGQPTAPPDYVDWGA